MNVFHGLVAVMFTFSFSSAFAATTWYEDTYSATIGDAYFESLWTDYVSADREMNYWTIDKEVLAGFKAEVKALYDAFMQTRTEADGYVTTVPVLNDDVLNFESESGSTEAQLALKLAVAAAQFEADKAEELAKLATIPTYNYSAEVISSTVEEYVENLTKETADGKTYQEAVAMLVEYYTEQIEACDDNFNADNKVSTYKTASGNVKNVLTNVLLPMAYEANGVFAKTGAYDLVKPYGTVKNAGYITVGVDTNAWGTSAVSVDKQTEAAQIAAAKANNAALYAQYIAKYPTAEVKTYADKWLKVADILAEEKVAVNNPGMARKVYTAQADAIAKLEAYAARYGAELNADGELVRDAAAVQKYLEEGIVAIAKAADADVDTTYGAYEAKIFNAASEALAAKLQYVKDSVNKAVELTLADLADDYYAAEYAKIEAAAAKCTAAVAAATTETKVTEAYTTFTKAIATDKVAPATTLDTTWTAAENTLKAAAEGYVQYFNKSNGTTLATDDTDLDASTLGARIAKLVGESGLRTETEIKTLKEQAVAIAQALPTNAEVTAAKKALAAAVKAVPAKATIADLATVQAVADAIDALEALTANPDLTAAKKAINDAAKLINDAYNTQFAKSYATLNQKDATAVAALLAEIEAAVDTLNDLGYTATTYMEGLAGALETALNTIKTNEAAAVAKLINALPINITEASKAAVEAAREAYDAYVAKYTDITTLYGGTFAKEDGSLEDGYAADDIAANVLEVLTKAETVLGLNDKSEEIAKMEAIAAIEGLKIKASSTKAKGSITVKWTVSEEVEGVKYQVYKSTKAHSGYIKSITTTKTTFKNTKNLKAGTRYYYKVRAIGVVDGVTYYSDWSNKANRVAK